MTLHKWKLPPLWQNGPSCPPLCTGDSWKCICQVFWLSHNKITINSEPGKPLKVTCRWNEVMLSLICLAWLESEEEARTDHLRQQLINQSPRSWLSFTKVNRLNLLYSSSVELSSINTAEVSVSFGVTHYRNVCVISNLVHLLGIECALSFQKLLIDSWL